MKFREKHGELIEIDDMSVSDPEWYVRGWVSREEAAAEVKRWYRDHGVLDEEEAEEGDLEVGGVSHRWARWVPSCLIDETGAHILALRIERLPGWARVTVVRAGWLQEAIDAREAARKGEGNHA